MIDWVVLAALAAVTFVAALIITSLLRRYATTRSLLDHPNERSAHQTPTPRGGGLAIVVSFLGALGALTAFGAVPATSAIALGGGGLIVALTGFWDDHGHVPAAWRLLAHIVAASWLLAWLGDLPRISVLGISISIGPVAYAVAALFIVWVLNLYNFMDGIDGIASVEATTTAMGGVIVAIAAGVPQGAAVPALLGAAALGFLVWNWPPAKIFMGDVGSGFLGIVSAGLAIQAGLAKPDLLFAWLILLGVFVVDATMTLLRRALRKERVYEAHRSHAYQRAARHFQSHLSVTVSVGLINIFWLLPWALAVALRWLDGATALIIAYLPLLLLALRWRAGAQEDRQPLPPSGGIQEGSSQSG